MVEVNRKPENINPSDSNTLLGVCITDMSHRIRNDALLNMAHRFGKQHNLSELELLKRFTLMLLDLKDEAYQEKLDKLMYSTQPVLKI